MKILKKGSIMAIEVFFICETCRCEFTENLNAINDNKSKFCKECRCPDCGTLCTSTNVIYSPAPPSEIVVRNEGLFSKGVAIGGLKSTQSEKKYELVEKKIVDINGYDICLYRIRALRDFGNVKKGDLGGYIEKEENLSHDGNCWVYDNAKIFNNACVFENAKVRSWAMVRENAKVYGSARLYADVKISGNAKVFGTVEVFDKATINENAKVYGDAKIHDKVNISGNVEVFGDAKIHGDVYIFGNAKIAGNITITETAEL